METNGQSSSELYSAVRVVSLILGGGSYLFGPELLKIYTSDPKVIQCGMEILLYTTVTYFMCGLMDLFSPARCAEWDILAIPMLLSINRNMSERGLSGSS